MIPFSPPRIDQKIIDAVTEALSSGWITTGPRTKLLEKKLSEYCNVPATLCLNSATAGLEIVLRWYGVGPGDEVILPAYTYSATANVIIHCGATPVFVDVQDDFNIDPAEIEKHINERTKVIMPVDFAGMPCDYNEIMNMVEDVEIKKIFNPSTPEQKKLGRILVLADAAHSIGAKYHGKRTGGLADFNVFSFHAVKNLTTAEGGAVCINLPDSFDNEMIYRDLCVKTLHGQNKDALAKTQKGNWRYDIVEAGYKANMTDITAAIGLVELERYEEEILPKRRHIFNLYKELLSKFVWAIIPEFDSKEKNSSYHVFALRIKNVKEDIRDKIIAGIFDKDVSVNVHFIPVPMMSFYKNMGYDISDYPNTFALYESEISLPVYIELSDAQVQTVVDAVESAYNSVMEIQNQQNSHA